jgi:hypothetical protein
MIQNQLLYNTYTRCCRAHRGSLLCQRQMGINIVMKQRFYPSLLCDGDPARKRAFDFFHVTSCVWPGNKNSWSACFWTNFRDSDFEVREFILLRLIRGAFTTVAYYSSHHLSFTKARSTPRDAFQILTHLFFFFFFFC